MPPGKRLTLEKFERVVSSGSGQPLFPEDLDFLAGANGRVGIALLVLLLAQAPEILGTDLLGEERLELLVRSSELVGEPLPEVEEELDAEVGALFHDPLDLVGVESDEAGLREGHRVTRPFEIRDQTRFSEHRTGFQLTESESAV